jgi:hypothetical protein
MAGKKRRTRRTRKPALPGARPVPAAAEIRLLALARELTALARREPPAPAALADALRTLAAAFAPDQPLAHELCKAWLASRAAKTAALALAWAREQVRLALEELLQQRGVTARVALSDETRAWLLLAGCEALAHEPPGAAADRLRTLFEVGGLTEPPG